MIRRVVLSDLINEIQSGSRPKGGVSGDKGSIPSLGAEHLDGKGGICFANAKFVEQDFFDSMRRGIIKKNDVLIVKDGATTGKVSYVDDRFSFKQAAINEHVFRLAVNPNKASSRYIFYYLASDLGKMQILSDFRGATVGEISQEFIDKVYVPLPSSISEQESIANILDKANSVRQKRNQSLKLLDKFLHATFFEMFGHPVENLKNWNVFSLGQVLRGINNGESPICGERARNSCDEWAILKLSAVTQCRFYSEKNKVLPKNIDLKHRIEVSQGMVLMTRKNTKELVGACAYVFFAPKKLLLPDTIFQLVYDEDRVCGQYLWVLFTDVNFRKKIQNLATGTSGSMPNISKQKLSNLKIPLPPIKLQQKFANLVNCVEKIRIKMLRDSLEMDNQFNALAQRYFT